MYLLREAELFLWWLTWQGCSGSTQQVLALPTRENAILTAGRYLSHPKSCSGFAYVGFLWDAGLPDVCAFQ